VRPLIFFSSYRVWFEFGYKSLHESLLGYLMSKSQFSLYLLCGKLRVSYENFQAVKNRTAALNGKYFSHQAAIGFFIVLPSRLGVDMYVLAKRGAPKLITMELIYTL